MPHLALSTTLRLLDEHNPSGRGAICNFAYAGRLVSCTWSYYNIIVGHVDGRGALGEAWDTVTTLNSRTVRYSRSHICSPPHFHLFKNSNSFGYLETKFLK